MLELATKFPPQLTAFEKAWEAGYRGVEFWLSGELLADCESILALASQFEFRYGLHFPNQGPLTEAHLDQAVRLYEALNSEALVIHRPMFQQYGAGLLARAPQLRLGIENHRLDKEDFWVWAASGPGLTLDVEHLWKHTLRDAPLSELLACVEALLERFGDRLHHVHLPGYCPGGDEHRPVHHAPELAREVLTLLADDRFQRLVVSEARPDLQRAEDLERDVELFRQWKQAWRSRGPASGGSAAPPG